MSEDRLREELYYIAKFASKADLTDKATVDAILLSDEASETLSSVFGKRFLARIISYSRGKFDTNTCIVCGAESADNGVICQGCMDRILNSDYARNKEEKKKKALEKAVDNNVENTVEKTAENAKNKEEKSRAKTEHVPKRIDIKKSRKISLKTIVASIACLILVLLMSFQIWLLKMYYSIPDVNAHQENYISALEERNISSKDEALAYVLEDFPEEEGWQIRYLGTYTQFAGYFEIEPGQCCDDVAETLTEEERYDFFWGIDVYRFAISYNQDLSVKIADVEVNEDGQVIIIGSLNDDRQTDKYYKIR